MLFLTGGLLFLCLLVNMTIRQSHSNSPDHPHHVHSRTFISLPADGPPGSQGASYLQQPPKAKAVEGEDVVFPCFLKRDVDEVLAVEKVRWYVQSLEGRKNVLQGNETVEDEFAGRVILSGDLSEGDLSMTLRNISVEDQGLYLCVFISTRSTVLQGGGTKLSIRKGWVREDQGCKDISVKTTFRYIYVYPFLSFNQSMAYKLQGRAYQSFRVTTVN